MKYCVIVKYVYSWKGLSRVEIDWNKKKKKNEDINSCIYALIQLSGHSPKTYRKVFTSRTSQGLQDCSCLIMPINSKGWSLLRGRQDKKYSKTSLSWLPMGPAKTVNLEGWSNGILIY